MDNLEQRLIEQEKRLEEIHRTMRQLKNYFMWTFIITLVFFVLPLIALIFVIPQFLSLYSGLGGLGL